MEFTVKKFTLSPAVQRVVAMCLKTKLGSAYAYIRIDLVDGRLDLLSSSPEYFVKTSCKLESSSGEGTFVIHTSRLVQILKMCGQLVTFSLEDKKLNIVSDNTKWIEPITEKEIAQKTVPPLLSSQINSHTLLTAFNSCRYAMDTDSIRPSLYMVDILNGRVRACNGQQYFEENTGVKNLNMSISASVFDGLITILRHYSSDLLISSDEDYHYIVCEEDTIAIKKIQTKFPDLDRLLLRTVKSQIPSLLQVSRSDLLFGLQQVKVSSEDDYPFVELHINKGEILLKCARKSGSVAVSKVAAVWDGIPRVATFTANDLVDTLKSAENEDLEIRFGSDTKANKSPMVIEGSRTWMMLNQMNLNKN